MTSDALAALESMTEQQAGRWRDVLDRVAGMLPDGTVCVLVEGGGHAGAVAARLADHLTAAGRRCVRPRDGDPEITREPGAVAIGAGTGERARPPGEWDVVIRLRTRHAPEADTEQVADIVIDLNDTRWPVIRRVVPRLAGHDDWYVAESRAFFAPRAATWDARFGDDMPAYAAAVGEAAVPPGATVLDAGCGTGRALPALRAAVGPTGRVFGVDVTPEMLAVARTTGRAHRATLLVADARRLPFTGTRFDAVFAAGLVQHLPDPAAGLAELARVTRPGGELIVFHPSGRAALAARHGRTPRPDEPLAETRLVRLLASTGWHLKRYDDADHRFFALAVRR
ncbi:class I SAM-dependent methyltransferase [Actinomadura terrae]|uniref:class I SAM-dependent methyltransferase n=1 Tax=Actinomadura terrae TaxID=604353 RepID=UPI001FA6BACC|nr:methyltransferase domain-containing protein [Actinomadura terrae]